MQVDVKVNPCVEDVEVLITAEKKTQFVNDLVEVIWDFDKHTFTTITGYIGNRAYIIKVADILRIFALNQKVYNQLPRCKHSSTVLGSYVAAHSTCLSLLLPQARKRGMKVCLSLFYI